MAKNGNSKGTRDGDVVTLPLSQTEQDLLRVHNNNIAQLKIEIANVRMQIDDMERRYQELTATVRAEAKRYEDDLRSLARAKGIDAEQAVSFDPQKMTFTGTRMGRKPEGARHG